VRRILTEWAAIDWFEPARATAVVEATRAFEEHHRRARLHEPELFPDKLELDVLRGGWPEFTQLCVRVRTQEWEWKFGALKKLSQRHSRTHGWSLSDAAPGLGEFRAPGPGDLFVRHGGLVFWNVFGIRLHHEGLLAPNHEADAYWYLGFATMDLIECIEWQLAEPGVQLDENPFVPLLHCYAAGLCPFSFGPSEVALFGF
jgi:hypothetical protein